jgi:hypothetical protein
MLRTVIVTINIGVQGKGPTISGQNEEPVKISIPFSAVSPKVPDSELIRRAGNIFRAAALDATYEINK